MRVRTLLFLAALLLPAACGEPPRPAAPSSEIVVAAAASLRELLLATAPAFEAAHPGTKVAFNFGASSTLARQIAEGAGGYGVFLSADAQTLDRVRGEMDPATITPFLANQLALLVREGADRSATRPADLVDRSGPFALAGPEVPAGRYARAWLEKNGLLQPLTSRIVNGASVRAALGLVESGAAEYAFVYATEARVAKTAQVVWTAPADGGASIVYVGAALRHASDAERAYLRWLSSPTFLESAEDLGFHRLSQ
jgi:molybdate transport system substrate-binding protein